MIYCIVTGTSLFSCSLAFALALILLLLLFYALSSCLLRYYPLILSLLSGLLRAAAGSSQQGPVPTPFAINRKFHDLASEISRLRPSRPCNPQSRLHPSNIYSSLFPAGLCHAQGGWAHFKELFCPALHGTCSRCGEPRAGTDTHPSVELWVCREQLGSLVSVLQFHCLPCTFPSCSHWAWPRVDPEAKYLQVFLPVLSLLKSSNSNPSDIPNNSGGTPHTSSFLSLSLLPSLAASLPLLRINISKAPLELLISKTTQKVPFWNKGFGGTTVMWKKRQKVVFNLGGIECKKIRVVQKVISAQKSCSCTNPKD
ncbi:uncharacterized protein LOC127059602 [Serinus canaria]|uniref:uncharacterized protein LOC127059602 n=1 Tax=Serinus canaria TaxID=9135 RepID=UPI0021CC80ED|nr:uncharacterized protein LOC127059602 [Serinus canaria]XP_050830323.1 uncharacterized protein LOC127059602 [Serinus canaria]XP_050830325.1 uncharacterized protein LOC127059602 [Serinus canaria]